jgi:hypothetical protein
MLEPVGDLPRNVKGLRATGTVVERDVGQAVASAAATEAGAHKNDGFVVFLAPEFNGYLAELIRGLKGEAEREPPLFTRWAFIVNDDVVDEMLQYGQFAAASNFRVFSDYEQTKALKWVAG